MQPHNLLPPVRIVALGGPVSRALAAMRSDPHAVEVERVRELRRAIAARIAADLDLLDALTPDADLEPSLGASEPLIAGPDLDWTYGSGDDRERDAGDEGEQCCDREPWLCGLTADARAVMGRGGSDDLEMGVDDMPDRRGRHDPGVADGARRARQGVEAITRRRRGGFEPGGLRIIGSDGHDYRVSRALR